MRLLAVSDEIDERLGPIEIRRIHPDLVVACGDVPFERLAVLVEVSAAPVVFVPGNHDPDISGYRSTGQGLVVRSGFVTEAPWPPGSDNVDGRIADIAGLRIAGLGGSRRYRDGPNQYSERQQARRARRLVLRARRQGLGRVAPLDLLVTHAGPRGVGDGSDLAHRGFECYLPLVRRLRPRLFLHGHHAPLLGRSDHTIGATQIINVFGHRVIDLPDRPGPPSSSGYPGEAESSGDKLSSVGED